MTLHPDAVAALAQAALAGGRPFEEGSPEDARAAFNRVAPSLQGERVPIGSTADRVIDGPGGPLALRILRGTGAPASGAAALLYCHGGGWVLGHLDSHDDICRVFAQAADAVVVCPDYRLAPEHKFPAAIEDCRAALLFMQSHADEIGIDAGRIAVAGDSAGGNLAAVLALMGRDGTAPRLEAQLLFYPNTDARQSSDTYGRFREGYGLTAATMAWFRDQYIRAPRDIVDWRVSPLLADTLEGAPPVFVALADCDILADEGAAYVARLAEAGVPTVLRRWPGQIHGFVSMSRYAEAARQAVDDAVTAWRSFVPGETATPREPTSSRS